MANYHSRAGTLGGIASSVFAKAKKRQNIINYDKSPKLCVSCKKSISYEKRRNDFCSQSCSASYNNLGKRKIVKKEYICACGNKKYQKAISCHKCKVNRTMENALSKTLGACLIEGNARVKYSYVRELARKLVFKIHKYEKKCKICNFDLFVDVCHIKPLCEFEESVLVREVNALSNLAVLCPNHHKMLDRKLLKL